MLWLFIIFVAVTALIPLRSVILGGIPFWFDPARDMLLAWNNLSKITLIGPPGGLPGIFYGPYWIWLLSLPMILTKNPRLITLLAITIPYLILFPLFLWKLKKYFGPATIFILWTIFITNFDSFLTFPWSPYPAALLYLILAYLTQQNKNIFWIGFVAGLILNFNFSFGVTVVVATFLFQLLTNFRKFFRFLAGLILVFAPIILFELRHNFMQSRAFLDSVLKSAIYNSAVVGQTGMPKSEIISSLLAVPAGFLHLPKIFFGTLAAIFVVCLVWKKLYRDRLMIFLFSSLAVLLFIYFSTKNPVWPYYFIGTQTIFLLIFGMVVAKFKLLQIAGAFLAIWLFFMAAQNFIKTPFPDFVSLPTLVSKENITRYIITDSKTEPYTALAYSPAIYTYDYDYLFRWLEKNPRPSDKLIYLIIPPASESITLDFIHYKTPDQNYQTLAQKTFPDGTVVIKRLKNP